MIYLEDMSQRTQKAVNEYYNTRSWIWATEAVNCQKTRTARILATGTGTLKGIADKLDIEKCVALVLLVGLEHMGKVEIHHDMGMSYRVV